MAQDITVTLSNEQVAAGLEYARKLFPDATNEDLRAKLEEAAYYGPGIRLVIGEWEYEYTRQTENEQRQESLDEFNAIFPPEPEPDPPSQ